MPEVRIAMIQNTAINICPHLCVEVFEIKVQIDFQSTLGVSFYLHHGAWFVKCEITQQLLYEEKTIHEDKQESIA